MKKLLQKTVWTFTILILMNWTANAQNDSTSICTGIHYTIEQDRAAQECWENHFERQQITNELRSALDFLTGEYHVLKIKSAGLEKSNTELSDKNSDLKTKVNRNRWGWIGTTAISIGGFVLLSASK